MNICLNCQNETKNPKFCSRSCSAQINNKGKRRYGKAIEPSICTSCNKEYLPSRNVLRKYCSNKCQGIEKNKKIFESGSRSPRVIRMYLLNTRIHECSVCSNSIWNNKLIPLEVDHINGNHSDNSLENLRLICPNCHAQTSTYKAKNIGNGRAFRRQRYAEGKSY